MVCQGQCFAQNFVQLLYEFMKEIQEIQNILRECSKWEQIYDPGIISTMLLTRISYTEKYLAIINEVQNY